MKHKVLRFILLSRFLSTKKETNFTQNYKQCLVYQFLYIALNPNIFLPTNCNNSFSLNPFALILVRYQEQLTSLIFTYFL